MCEFAARTNKNPGVEQNFIGRDGTAQDNVPSEALIGNIPESQVIFDATGGHDHDGSGSTPIPMSGDVIGTNTATVISSFSFDLEGDVNGSPINNTVQGIQNASIDAPEEENDGSFIQYDAGNNQFVYSDVNDYVTKLRGARVPGPIGANDGEVLTYNQLKNNYELKTPTFKVAAKTTDYTASVDDMVVVVNATAAVVTITLPTAVGNSGKVFIVKKTDVSANAVTVAAYSGETIDGAATSSLPLQYNVVRVVSDGVVWWVI